MHGVYWKEAMRKRDIQKREARTEKKAQILGGQNLFNLKRKIHTMYIFPVDFLFFLIETSESS